MRKLFGTISALLLALSTGGAGAVETCSELSEPISSLTEVQDFYPVFVKDGAGHLYKFEGSCAYLRGRRFRGSFDLVIKNNFESGLAILKAKSLRTFGTTTAPKFKYVRDDGWFKTEDTRRPRDRLRAVRDEAIGVSLENWNRVHSSSDTRLVNDGLGANVHGYTGTNPVLTSLDVPAFWQLSQNEDMSHKTMTTYLIRFTASRSQNEIPITIFTPPGVSRIDFELDSNIGALQSTVSFLFSDETAR